MLGAAWCMIVRECRRCRAVRVAAEKRRLRAAFETARFLVADELRAEGVPWRE